MRGQNVAFYELPHNCQWSDLPLLLPFRLRQQFIIPIFARQPMLGQNVGHWPSTGQTDVAFYCPTIASAPVQCSQCLQCTPARKNMMTLLPMDLSLAPEKRAKSMFDGFTFSYGFLFSCIAGSRATLCTDHKIDSPIKIEKKPVLQFQTEPPVQAPVQAGS